MNERRRFLQVLGGSVMAAGAGCSSTTVEGTGGNTGTGGDTGAGGGAGGGTTSSSSSSSSASSTASSSSGSGCSPTGVNAGMPSAYATDGLHKVSGTTVLIGRDAGGLYALSSLCTHQSCNLNTKGVFTATGIHCNCHGAEFDTQGNATKWPATNPLKAFQLTVECDGNLWVDKTKVVPSSQRLMV